MIGFDLEHISRIRNAEKLLEKIATASEIAYIEKFKNKLEKVASLWAVKEATFKALDISAGEISYKEIELHHKESGKPFLKFSGKAEEILKKKGGKEVEISLSHSLDMVGAVAIVVF